MRPVESSNIAEVGYDPEIRKALYGENGFG